MSRAGPRSLRDRGAVSLEELDQVASLQTRVDRKYLIPESSAELLLALLHDDVAVLRIDGDQQFFYESLYFDTPDLQSYLLAAKRRPNRFKVRTRTYHNSGLCMLEVKCKNGRAATVKHRATHAFHDRGHLTASARDFVDAATGMDLAGRLSPVLSTTFWRTTLLDRSDGSRATLDEDIGWHIGEAASSLPGHVVVETKTLGTASAVDRWLWGYGHRPTSLSKYCVGMALHDPTLPANKWNRLLRTSLGWVPERGPAGEGRVERPDLWATGSPQDPALN